MKPQANPLLPLYREKHWFLANSPILNAWLQHGVPTDIYGPRGKWVWRLMNYAFKLHMVLLLTRVIGIFESLRWWWRAGTTNKVLTEENAIFVGFGAGPEENMWARFCRDNNGRAIRLDQTKVATFGAFHRPALITLLCEIWHQSTQAHAFISTTKIEPVASYRLHFLSSTAMRIAQYVFYKCWWQEVNNRKIKRVVFISADTPAFACLDAGVANVEFHQHGLLRKSVLLPTFQHMKILTNSESRYFSALMPNCKISCIDKTELIRNHQLIILIASLYDIPNLNKMHSLSILQDLSKWADKNKLKIIVRKHPKENDDFWIRYFPDLHIDTISDSFDEVLLRIKPMIMVTWFSTTLVDALRSNIIPVSISPMGDVHVQDLIIDLRMHCLSWQKDRHVLDEVVNGKTAVSDIVSRIESSATV